MKVQGQVTWNSTSSCHSKVLLTNYRWLAAIAAGAAFVVELSFDICKLRLFTAPARTDVFALFDQIIMRLAIAANLAALGRNLLQYVRLAPVLPHARALFLASAMCGTRSAGSLLRLCEF